MKKNKKSLELSYYRLTLLSYLKESHPHLASDTEFIKTRANEAAETYAEAIREGLSHPEAEELANLTLFNGLLFSAYDTLIHVLWNEFSTIVAQSEATDYAQKLLPQCESIFQKYILSDEFGYSSEYNTLYTELTGFIVNWLEDNEL